MKARIKISCALLVSMIFLSGAGAWASHHGTKLIIRTSPKGAVIKVDGRLLNSHAPVGVLLSPGRHRISAGIPGYRVSRRTVQVFPGINHLHLSLTRNSGARERSVSLASSPESGKTPSRYKSRSRFSRHKSSSRISKGASAPSSKSYAVPEARPAAAESDKKYSKYAADYHDEDPGLLPLPEKTQAPAWPESAEEKMLKLAVDIPRFPDKLNILILGLDRRDRRGIYARGREIPPEKLKRIRARSDTIMVAQIDLAELKIRIVSIPRDTRVYLSRRGCYGKINEAYFMGRTPYAEKIIGRFLDMPIHRHLVLDYRSAKTLIKIYHSLGFNFRGYDDSQLFWYLRKRSFRRGDLRRIERQQDFIRAISKDCIAFASRMRGQHGIIGWAEQTLLDTVLEQALEYVDTNLTAEEIRCLAYIFRYYEPDELTFATCPGRVKGKRFGEDDEKYISYFYPARRHSFDQIIAAVERKRLSMSP
jgi:anionic cell wall polymer biosynthesis LytR-Cps2A-Psr (LCP) family protein